MYKYAIVSALLLVIQFVAVAQNNHSTVQITGAMRNVMWKGELAGTISLDTISNKEHLYGLGPVEFLAGELLVADGITYRSTVVTDTTMKVETIEKVKAPFFVYANVANWKAVTLPDPVTSIKQLENYLDLLTQKTARPFCFRLEGMVEKATLHIMNLPAGATVHSPEQAQQGQKKYYLQKEAAILIGFFSTQHQSVFTHHDTYVHLHLLTKDKLKMGHLEEVVFAKGTTTLYLPAD